MAILWLFPAACVIAISVYHYLKCRSYLYRTVEKYFHGPRPIPIIGNALEFPIKSTGFLDVSMKLASEIPRRFRFWLGPDPFVVLYDPEDIEALLSSTTHITKSDVYRFAIPCFGYGLVTSTGAKWKSRRRILTPTFHFKILEDFLDIFEANGHILIEQLRENSGRPAFDVYAYCNRYALDNIVETAMGTSINAQKTGASHYLNAVKELVHAVNLRIYKPWLMPDMLFNISKHGFRHRECLKIVHGYSKKIIEERRQIFKAKIAEERIHKNVAEDDLNRRKKLAFLDCLIEAAETAGFTDEDIQEEVNTFVLAGHETVTSATSFALYELSRNPDIQEKVLEEQKEIFGDSDRAATLKDYNDMKYLERVLKEVLRLYPSTPMIARMLHEDLKLSDGSILPKGVQPMILLPALHKNPDIWEDPEKFDPDRFLPENTIKRSPYAYVPFSAGPRNCIGIRFANLELKSCVSKVVRNFKLLPCAETDKINLVAEITLISSNGVNILIEERDK